MLERLVPGDRVMCIPTEDDRGCTILIPYGAGGVIVEGDGDHEGSNLLGGSIKKRNSCIVKFDNHVCFFHKSGNWVRVRSGLMKITPDETMKEEEKEVIEMDALPPLLTLEQAANLFKNESGDNRA